MTDGIRTKLGKMMNWLMLSCEDATFLITKKEKVSLSFIEALQLKMHLLSCKMCQRFDIQNEKLSSEWNKLDIEHKHMSEQKKIEIENILHEEMEK